MDGHEEAEGESVQEPEAVRAEGGTRFAKGARTDESDLRRDPELAQDTNEG
jgi:hypothetical protein